MLDAYIPEGALSPEAEDKLLARLTDLLLQHEGVDPANPAARALAWVFVHRPRVYVGGSEAPEGQYDDERRQAVTALIEIAGAGVQG